MKYKSSLGKVCFPAIMTGQVAMLMALQRQYEDSQWWKPGELEDAQFCQITKLAEHAMRTVPFHARRLKDAGYISGMPMTRDIWKRLPPLTREEVRDHGSDLHATSRPRSFEGLTVSNSGGSTGIPVRVLKTGMDGLMWQTAHLRELKWHGIDTGLELANSMGMSAEKYAAFLNMPGSSEEAGGLVIASWGPPMELFSQTGPMGIFQPHHPIERQVDFLMKRQPSYLRIMPSALRLLLVNFRERGLVLDSIRCVWTMSESVDESLRQFCHEIFGCPLLSNYTSNETGYIALQCPTGNNFHVVSESVLVEVVDDNGNDCKPGGIGRVLVTPLHNFAMPLLRYQVGDEAEVGPPCSCGRGLPSLTRIVGRLEDYVILPSGRRRRLDLEHYKISQIRAVKEFQLVQLSVGTMELRLVVSGNLTQGEWDVLEEVMKRSFEGYLEWIIVIVDSLPRTQAGKLRQFVSEMQTT